jgi:hypothetical protein
MTIIKVDQFYVATVEQEPANIVVDQFYLATVEQEPANIVLDQFYVAIVCSDFDDALTRRRQSQILY